MIDYSSKIPSWMNYSLIRSGRRTLAIYVKLDGSVEVRAPRNAKLADIESILIKKQDWIRQTQENMKHRQADQRIVTLDANQVKQAREAAKQLLSKRCAFYAARMGVDYRSIKINGAKTRWGSCTSKGDLNFTYRLIFAESELLDYIVVHELAHRKEMNHSKAFWTVVAEELSDYKQRRTGLKEFQRKIQIIESEK